MDYVSRYIWPPSSPFPHFICQRALSCGNNVRLALLLTGCRSQSSAQFLREDQEPLAFRGGLAGEFQVYNAPNLQQSYGKKECCEQRRQWWYVCGALVCRRWADWNRSGFITTGSPSLQRSLNPSIIWGKCQAVGGWPATQPDRGRLQPMPDEAFSDWFILISFSNCPRRCCFPQANAAQASMARFIFSWHLISLQESTVSKLPTQPFASARTSIAAPARTQACLQWENSMIKLTHPGVRSISICGEE